MLGRLAFYHDGLARPAAARRRERRKPNKTKQTAATQEASRPSAPEGPDDAADEEADAQASRKKKGTGARGGSKGKGRGRQGSYEEEIAVPQAPPVMSPEVEGLLAKYRGLPCLGILSLAEGNTATAIKSINTTVKIKAGVGPFRGRKMIIKPSSIQDVTARLLVTGTVQLPRQDRQHHAAAVATGR